MSVTLSDLRRFAVARSLFRPTTLARALDALGFVQADPIRAPARAQDLTLRHRVAGYRAGDLERQYETLGIEEDIFINYGFVTREVSRLMHPRGAPQRGGKRELALLDFVRTRGAVHPREVDAHFAHGRVTNYWGGSSSATTYLLERMHYRGLVRVVRRDAGIRIYEARAASAPPVDKAERAVRLDALVDVAVRKYAPLPGPSLATLVSRLRYAAPQWKGGLKQALQRARARLAHEKIDGVDWYWPADEAIPYLRRRPRLPSGAVRPGCLGSAPLRAAMGLGLPLRGVHACQQAEARVLRAAAALARARHRLGQHLAGEGRREGRPRIRHPPAPRPRVHAGARRGAGSAEDFFEVGSLKSEVGSLRAESVHT